MSVRVMREAAYWLACIAVVVNVTVACYDFRHGNHNEAFHALGNSCLCVALVLFGECVDWICDRTKDHFIAKCDQQIAEIEKERDAK